MVPQYIKDHLKIIISLPPDWPGDDTTQMILWHTIRGCPPLPSGLMKYSPQAMSVFPSRIQEWAVPEGFYTLNHWLYHLNHWIVVSIQEQQVACRPVLATLGQEVACAPVGATSSRPSRVESSQLLCSPTPDLHCRGQGDTVRSQDISFVHVFP